LTENHGLFITCIGKHTKILTDENPDTQIDQKKGKKEFEEGKVNMKDDFKDEA
jgi:hypothetical protein